MNITCFDGSISGPRQAASLFVALAHSLNALTQHADLAATISTTSSIIIIQRLTLVCHRHRATYLAVEGHQLRQGRGKLNFAGPDWNGNTVHLIHMARAHSQLVLHTTFLRSVQQVRPSGGPASNHVGLWHNDILEFFSMRIASALVALENLIMCSPTCCRSAAWKLSPSTGLPCCCHHQFPCWQWQASHRPRWYRFMRLTLLCVGSYCMEQL